MERPLLALSPPYFDPPIDVALQKYADGYDDLNGRGQRVLLEEEFSTLVGAQNSVAVQSGTAAIHLALRLAGVGPGDEVWVSNFTFCASVNPVYYLGANPVLIGSEWLSWNMDPNIVEDLLIERSAAGRLPKAIVLVHVYGQSADLRPIADLCVRYGIVLIEDAAEALGTLYKGEQVGMTGTYGAFSFNSNKIITATGGGMLVTKNSEDAETARRWAAQARENARYYLHHEVGFNYQMSPVLAAILRTQIPTLGDRVTARRQIFDWYRRELEHVPALTLMPDVSWGQHSRWLSCILIDWKRAGVGRDEMLALLSLNGIEARPLWKPLHTQPAYTGVPVVHRGVDDALFRDGVCLPSGTAMTETEVRRVAAIMKECLSGHRVL